MSEMCEEIGRTSEEGPHSSCELKEDQELRDWENLQREAPLTPTIGRKAPCVGAPPEERPHEKRSTSRTATLGAPPERGPLGGPREAPLDGGRASSRTRMHPN
jgi:hypothetical protein